MTIKGSRGQQFTDIQFGSFGDFRDEYAERQFNSSTRMYQPPGSSKRFELREQYGTVSAYQLGRPDEILPGGRAQKSAAGVLNVWGGGTGNDDRPEILHVQVKKGHQGLGLSEAMLNMAHAAKPDLSHSGSLSAEGARFAARNPLPNDSERTKAAQRRHITADAATAMLGGPRRRGFNA